VIDRTAEPLKIHSMGKMLKHWLQPFNAGQIMKHSNNVKGLAMTSNAKSKINPHLPTHADSSSVYPYL